MSGLTGFLIEMPDLGGRPGRKRPPPHPLGLSLPKATRGAAVVRRLADRAAARGLRKAQAERVLVFAVEVVGRGVLGSSAMPEAQKKRARRFPSAPDP